MKKSYIPLLTSLLLGSCTVTSKYNPNNYRIPAPVYQKLVELLEKKHGLQPNEDRSEERAQQVQEIESSQSQLEEKTNESLRTFYNSQSNTEELQTVQHSANIVDFLINNYGEETIRELIASLKYEEIIEGLEKIPKYQQVIPLLYKDLELQINNNWFRKVGENNKFSTSLKLVFLSLLTKLQDNPNLSNLIIDLSKKGVHFNFTDYEYYPLIKVFSKIEEWKAMEYWKSFSVKKPQIHFSGEPFLELILERQDLLEFVENPQILDEELEQYLSSKDHYISQPEEGLIDVYEHWQNYTNLDLLQKLQLREVILALDLGKMRDQVTELIDLDLKNNNSEEGGLVKVSDYRLVLERVPASGKGTNLNYAIPSNKFNFNGSTIGMFHLHALTVDTSRYAGPSNWFPEKLFSPDGHLQMIGDLASAMLVESYNGKHALNLVITSINENTFDVNLYYAVDVNGRPVNVSVGAFKRTIPYTK